MTVREAMGIFALSAGVSTAAGCLRTRPSLTDPDPANKIPAMRQAADQKDASAAPQLVKDLNDDDSAVRFYAFRALHAISGGETFGFRYYDDTEMRKPAVAKWQQWLAKRGKPARSK